MKEISRTAKSSAGRRTRSGSSKKRTAASDPQVLTAGDLENWGFDQKNMKILLIHGVNTNEDTNPYGPWITAITSGLQNEKFGGSIVPSTFNYNDIFASYSSDPNVYLDATLKLLADALKNSVLPRTMAAGAPGEQPGPDFMSELRWSAGMVAQWVSEADLRADCRKRLSAAIQGSKPDIIFAHSLGTLLCYDLLCGDNGDNATGIFTNGTLVTFGSQIGNTFIKDSMWRNLGMLPVGTWINLYNPHDPVFVAPLDIKADRFYPFVPVFGSYFFDLSAHEVTQGNGHPGYLDSPVTNKYLWSLLTGGNTAALIEKNMGIMRLIQNDPARVNVPKGLITQPGATGASPRTTSSAAGLSAEFFLAPSTAFSSMETQQAVTSGAIPGWKSILATASPSQTLNRGHQGLGRGTIYELGAGGTADDIGRPLTRQCDCSGFVCWAIGVPRECPPGSDHWLYTDNIWEGGGDVGKGLFDEIQQGAAQTGDLYVYPAPNSSSHGHIAIITAVTNGAPNQILHCSLSNFERTGDAVRETTPIVFTQNKISRIMRPNYDALRRTADQQAVSAASGATSRITDLAEQMPGNGERESVALNAAAPALQRIDTLYEVYYSDETRRQERRDVQLYSLEDRAGFFHRGSMQIDVDGSPRAYYPQDSSTLRLDLVANAGRDSKTYVQGTVYGRVLAKGPRRGFYVSATSLRFDPRIMWQCDNFVDAEAIPYFIYPPNRNGVELGDLGIIVHIPTMTWTSAIFGDSNDSQRVSEASLRVAVNLGLSKIDPVTLEVIGKSAGDGIDNQEFFYLYFPGSAFTPVENAPHWPENSISNTATAKFQLWGGLDMVRQCLQQMS
jgi:hypothetical protein